MSESTRHSDGRGHHFAGPGALDRALSLVRFLRKECPWDQAQTAHSLIPYLLEETHEVVDAIREGSPAELEGELGDLLLNLAFQIVVAEEDETVATRVERNPFEERLERAKAAVNIAQGKRRQTCSFSRPDHGRTYLAR